MKYEFKIAPEMSNDSLSQTLVEASGFNFDVIVLVSIQQTVFPAIITGV